jgi:hypothetical protein
VQNYQAGLEFLNELAGTAQPLENLAGLAPALELLDAVPYHPDHLPLLPLLRLPLPRGAPPPLAAVRLGDDGVADGGDPREVDAGAGGPARGPALEHPAAEVPLPRRVPAPQLGDLGLDPGAHELELGDGRTRGERRRRRRRGCERGGGGREEVLELAVRERAEGVGPRAHEAQVGGGGVPHLAPPLGEEREGAVVAPRTAEAAAADGDRPGRPRLHGWFVIGSRLGFLRSGVARLASS